MHFAAFLLIFLVHVYTVHCGTSEVEIYNNKTEDSIGTVFLFEISISSFCDECESQIQSGGDGRLVVTNLDISLKYLCCEFISDVLRNCEIYWSRDLWYDRIKESIICYGVGKVFSVSDNDSECKITESSVQQRYISEKTDTSGITLVKKTGNDKEDDLVTIPWQSLWLLQPTHQDCGFQDVMLSLRDVSSFLDIPEWLKLQPDEPIGPCPVRFRSHVDHHRLWPRNLIVTECLCEGSRCARRGLQVCVTVYAKKTIYRYFTGKKRVMLPVGCLCAVQRAVYVKPIVPKIVS